MGDVADGPLYGTFARRMRALVLDGLVLGVTMFAIVVLASVVEFGRTARLSLFGSLIGLAIMYEPVLVAFNGSTIGQRLSNLRVVAPTPNGRLPLWKAFMRWLLKAVTGLGSFATMGATRRNQALHDLAFDTTVQIVNPSLARERDFIVERAELGAGRLPSAGRRLVVIVGYLVGLMILLTLIMPIFASTECVDRRVCASGERLWTEVVATAWLMASVAVCSFGWKGRLFGVRRRVTPEVPSEGTPGGVV